MNKDYQQNVKKLEFWHCFADYILCYGDLWALTEQTSLLKPQLVVTLSNIRELQMEPECVTLFSFLKKQTETFKEKD